jgi:hypothetical protein
MIINPYIFGIPYTPIFDTYGSPTIGFSMFKLRTAYTGNCLEVRRSSDNTTLNIGFVNNYLDTASLLAFVGSGNGFVRTWYDQSGNGRDLTQTTSASYQPQIVASGSLITRNGIATIKANSTQYLTLLATINGTTARSWWFSCEKDTTGNQAILGSNGSAYMWMDYGASQYVGNADFVNISPSLSINTFRLINVIYTTASYKMWNNGSQIGSNVGGTDTMTLYLVPMVAFRTTTVYFNELVYWQTNQTSNRSAIETDIKTRNLIY